MWPAQLKLNSLKFRGTRKRDECSICIEYGRMYTLRPCQHRFHKDCISQWLSWNSTCPECRQQVEGNQLNAFRQYGLERQFGNTPLLNLTYSRPETANRLADAHGSVLQTSTVREPIEILLKNELLIQDVSLVVRNVGTFAISLPGSNDVAQLDDIVEYAKRKLFIEDWSNAFLGYESALRPPFNVVAQDIDDGIVSETLSIREGVLVEWWKLYKGDVLESSRQMLRDALGL